MTTSTSTDDVPDAEARGPRARVEAWEDGRRQMPGGERAELWHFEAGLSDGTIVAIGFCLVGVDPEDPGSLQTVVNVMLTTPDGARHEHAITGTTRTDEIGTDRCALPFGRNTAHGDLRTYDVHVETDDGGLRIDLRYDALTEALLPVIASPVVLNAGRGPRFSELVVARCAVTGTVVVDGTTTEVTGLGAHDHQWFDANPLTTWHHWLWGRLYTEHFSAVLFDLVASRESGLERVPVFAVFDATGALLLDNEHPVELVSELQVDPGSGKAYPLRSTYRFRDGARTVELSVERQEDLISHDLYGAADGSEQLGGASRQQFDDMGVRPSYARCRGIGTLVVTDHGSTVQESGELLYELNYPGKDDPATFAATA